MSDLQKKYQFDEQGNRVSLMTGFPKKFEFAKEELEHCINCLDSVSRCASNSPINLTDVQVHQTYNQLSSMVDQLNSQFEQQQKEKSQIDNERKELEEDKKLYRNSMVKYMKITSAIVSVFITVVGYAAIF